MVLRNVRRFMVIEHTHEFPFCSSLIAHFEKHPPKGEITLVIPSGSSVGDEAVSSEEGD
jgi:hypothetical protein